MQLIQIQSFTQLHNEQLGRKGLVAILVVAALSLTTIGPSPVGAQVGPEDPVADAEGLVCENVLNGTVVSECVTPVRKAWEVVENGPANAYDEFADMVTSADGTMAFGAGYMWTVDDEGAFATIYVTAYDTATGDVLWQYTHDRPGPGDAGNNGKAVALSPDETRLVVAGTPRSPLHGQVFVALDAEAGAEQWQVREILPIKQMSIQSVHFVSNEEFVVTGHYQPDSSQGYRIFASQRSAATGSESWAVEHTYGNGLRDTASALTADGSMLIVQAYTADCSSVCVYSWITVAWNIGGSLAWESIVTAPGRSQARGMTLGNNHVFITGKADVSTAVALDLATGEPAWTFENTFEGNTYDAVLSSDGLTLFVAGDTDGPFPSDQDYSMTALNAATGLHHWTTRTSTGGVREQGAYPTIALNEAKGQVSYTGMSSQEDYYPFNWDFATVAWDTTTGHHLWTELYNGAGDGTDYATATAMSPDGSQLFVGGNVIGENGNSDIGVVSYEVGSNWTITDLLPDV